MRKKRGEEGSGIRVHVVYCGHIDMWVLRWVSIITKNETRILVKVPRVQAHRAAQLVLWKRTGGFPLDRVGVAWIGDCNVIILKA